MSRRPCHLAAALLAAALVAPAPAAAAPGWTPYDRAATHEMVSEEEVPITMRDGVRLRANVYRPDGPGRFPVLITQTPYNKSLPLARGDRYLVERGYVHVVVDVRGTGSSEGVWDSFGPAEQRDMVEVVGWARRQPWSNGESAVYGASYMAITAILTAAQRPEGLEAMFLQVPMGDAYRDITFTGGQTNLAFIPFWLATVTAGSILPSTAALSETSPEGLIAALGTTLTTLAAHLSGVANFQASTVLRAVVADDIIYDGRFWKVRSPLERIDRVRVPTFVLGGLSDLFQRGEPLLYERLKQRVPARLIMGPWTHLGGSGGDGLEEHGLPSLDQLHLRWFDRYLKGKRKQTDVGEIPRSTWWRNGPGGYQSYRDWPDPSIGAQSWFLGRGGSLGRARPLAGAAGQTVVQNPASGICTRSTDQWTAGLGEAIPCAGPNNVNEPLDAAWTSAPLEKPLRFQGPIAANLWVVPSSPDAVLSVRVTDVAPDGTSTELSGGWLAGSFRKVHPRRSRWLDGKMIQPWHPFTRRSAKRLEPGKPYLLNVEVFPTNAVIEPGHRLRVTVGGADFPHSLPPLGQSLNSLAGRVEILNDAEHPSHLVLPVLGREKRSESMSLPHLIRKPLKTG